MKQRILFLLRTYGLTILIFLCAKVVFMFANRTAHPFVWTDVADVLRHGLTLDLSTALYFMVVPFLVTIVSIWRTGRGTTVTLRVWATIMAVAFALAFSADTALYPEWGYKLDATCLQYLANPEGAAASVTPKFLLLGFLGLALLVALLTFAFWKQIPQFRPLRHKLAYGILCLVATPLIFIGIRGGVDKSTTNIGQVYYSQTPFLNHSAVNPVFSFLASFESTVRTDVTYDFFNEEEALTLVDSLYNTQSLNPDTLLCKRRPNVLLVMLESAAGQFTKLNGKEHIMPNFNRMMDEGIFFSACYANSFRTDRATVSIWSGYPSFPTMSLQKDLKKNANLPGLARSLCKAGYATRYYYGGDINFTKKGSYLINAGFEELVSRDDFTREEQRSAQWGVCDEMVFNRIADEVESWGNESKNPHLIGYNTLSSHQPWDVPTHRLEDPVENAFNYLDQCMGDFVSRLRKSPAWENLLIIFVPDHGIDYEGMSENDIEKMHIPVLWMGGAVAGAKTVEVDCNQTDIAATLLGQLGLSHDEYRFSRDVMSETYTCPFAYHTFNNGFSLVEGERHVIYDLTANQIISGEGEDLVKRGKALLQVTSHDLSKR